MARPFRPVDRQTPFLFSPSVQEWLPDDHLARFIVEIVENLDLSRLEAAYAGRGSKAYHPALLLSLLFYGYATGVFSSRKLEAATYDSIAFRFICANTHPDHDTICTFRRRFLGELEELFMQILLIAHEMGLLELGTVSLDGTKVKANASKHKALSYGYAAKLEEQLQAEIEALLERAEKADRQEDEEALDIPAELERRRERLEVIRAAKEKIEERAEERYNDEQAAYEERMAKRRAKEEATGKKTPGRKPKPPEPGPREKDQVNLTDEESRIMPTGGGSFEQAYNAQTLVDVATHFILGSHVTQAPNDKEQLVPGLARLDELPEALGEAKQILADNGYFSEPNVEAATDRKIEPLIALGRQKHNVSLEERLKRLKRLKRPEEPSEGASALEQMAYRLRAPEGRAAYAQRKSTVETVFGMIKSAMGFRHFLLRGHEKVSGEWTLVNIAYNLKRLFRLARKTLEEAVSPRRSLSFHS